MVFPTFFNLCLNFPIRSSWSEPQSAPSFVFPDCIELLHLWLQRNQKNTISVLNIYLVMSTWRVFSCVDGTTSAFSWQNSVSLCPASLCTPRPKLPITPCISWPPNFAFQSPIFLKRWGYQTTLPASWEIRMQVKKKQLEMDMEQ